MGNTEQFDRMAERYDSAERKRVARLSAQAIAEYIPKKSKKVAMDFGCGTGLVGLELIEEFQSILFVDSSENMIQQVNKKLSTVDNPSAQTICIDLEVDNALKESVDVVFMSHVLLHIKDTKRVLEKLWNVLKPEGQVVLVDFNKNERIQSDLVHNGFDQVELARILSTIGFHQVQSKTFYEDDHLFMGKRASLFVMSAKK